MKITRSMRALALGLCLTAVTSPVFAGEKISLTVKDGDIKDVLNAIASLSGYSIVLDEAVQGTVTVDLNEVDPDLALDIISRAKQLSYTHYRDNIVFVTTNDNAEETGPLEVFKLQYANAQELSEQLDDMLEDGEIAYDAVTNSLMVTGSSSDINRIRDAVRALDVKTKQVTVEAQIIAINRNDGEDLGLNWSWTTTNTPATTNTVEYRGGGRFSTAHTFATGLQATLNALFTQGRAKIMACPNMLTIPGKEASIMIGDSIPVVTTTTINGETSTTTQYIDAGINLTYTPILADDGTITSVVSTSVNSVSTNYMVNGNYSIQNRSAQATVRMKDGETLVLGGLLDEEESKSLQEIPLLSKIPILGELFKYRSTSKQKTEVILLLTPHVTDSGESPSMYDSRAKRMQSQFDNFDSKDFNNEMKRSEASQKEKQLLEEQRKTRKELAEAEKQYGYRDPDAAKKRAYNPYSDSTKSREHRPSMRERVDRILAGEK